LAASGPEDEDSKALRNVGAATDVILDLAFPPRCLHPSGGGDLHNGIKGTHCYEASPFVCLGFTGRVQSVQQRRPLQLASVCQPKLSWVYHISLLVKYWEQSNGA